VTVIDSFSGRYRFLSNFYPEPVEWAGLRWPSVEHAFQGAKHMDHGFRELIRTARTPAEAKRIARSRPAISDWDDWRVHVMDALLRTKFSEYKMRLALCRTDPAELIEGNTWGDTYWGVCKGVGENMLGQLLMKIRSEPFLWNRAAGDYPPGAVYIGRGTPYGNRFVIGQDGDREEVVRRFECEVLPTLDVSDLRGKHLVCSCVPKACHGRPIMRKANLP